MKIQILGKDTVVYTQPTITSEAVSKLGVGDEIEILKTVRNRETTWLEVSLPNGKIGFISGNTEVFQSRCVWLNQEAVDILSVPAFGSKTGVALKKGDKFFLVKSVKQEEMLWLQVRNDSGMSGFIPATTKMWENLNGSALHVRLVRWAWAIFGIVFVLFLIGAGISTLVNSYSDYRDDLKNDGVNHRGGRSLLHDWVENNGLIGKIQQSKNPISDPPQDRSYTFVVWVFGDDFSIYGKSEDPTTIGVAEVGSTNSWDQASCVLMVKLRRVGSEEHQVVNIETRKTETESVTVYNAEAWLFDKNTCQCFAHEIFGPGDEPDASRSMMSTPASTLYDIDTIRFRAVDHAIRWATPSQNQ